MGYAIQFILHLVLIFLILRAFKINKLYKRVKSSQSIWLKGGVVDAEVLFIIIKQNITAKKFSRIRFDYKVIYDKENISLKHKYMKITFRGMGWYISAFPISEDYIISYWLINEKRNFLLNLINSIPVYGPDIVDLIITPTLYSADIDSATRTMIEEEIQNAIDEVTQDIPDKRETSLDFKTMVKEISKGKQANQ